MINIPRTVDVSHFDSTMNIGQSSGTEGHDIVWDPLWTGDWAKGPAGGYGTNEVTFTQNNDIWRIKAGMVAESTQWTVDWEKGEGTIVYKIRQGMRWALNPNSEASRLVNGREVTADDVIANLERITTDPLTYLFSRQPELRVAKITKTGPWEVSVKLPVGALVPGITRFGQARIQPPEVFRKYGSLDNWRNSVGSGPFMRSEYVANSAITYIRNPNYWMKDPIGPGKGNQLPYLDSVRFLILPDASTRQAALRTGKIDQMPSLLLEDAKMMQTQVPALKSVASELGSATTTWMRSDKPPFSDVRVRRAMMMAIDFEAINQGLYDGLAQIMTYPNVYSPSYPDIYVKPDDPDMHESVKELYTYNPEKAKQLLKEAGYPNGFKTSALAVASEVDEFSIYKDMWAKVGVELSIDVKEAGARTALIIAAKHEGMTKSGGFPVAIWYTFPGIYGTALQNSGMVNDPIINEAYTKINTQILIDEKEAMRQYRELRKHVLDQAYGIPQVVAPTYIFWWPWVKNYSGEVGTSYYTYNWPQFVWYDAELKKSMGR